MSPDSQRRPPLKLGSRLNECCSAIGVVGDPVARDLDPSQTRRGSGLMVRGADGHLNTCAGKVWLNSAAVEGCNGSNISRATQKGGCDSLL